MLPLINMLSSPKSRLQLIGEAPTAFKRIKAALTDATLLTHLAPEVQMSLIVDCKTADNRNFILFTDHTPLTLVLRSHSGTYNLSKIAHLDYISQFTTDIRHTEGTKNELVDMLFRPPTSAFQFSHEVILGAMAAEQI
ncbi:unnamed protein product [Dibothriocephalus latus]|uniref:Reverse transcriptase RNase H-like domain-containing protein n=1 Tax=Dibothriocephalus latus TaxID=60516 RepID=A0A3P7QWL2_DIBLA|nr:unnamed protein product [Dibothriocephalus latus]